MHNAQRQAANLRAANVDLTGQPYIPAKPRPWLDNAARADLAMQYDCDPREIEYRLDARDRMDAKIAERREYEDPYGYARARF